MANETITINPSVVKEAYNNRPRDNGTWICYGKMAITGKGEVWFDAMNAPASLSERFWPNGSQMLYMAEFYYQPVQMSASDFYDLANLLPDGDQDVELPVLSEERNWHIVDSMLAGYRWSERNPRPKDWSVVKLAAAKLQEMTREELKAFGQFRYAGVDILLALRLVEKLGQESYGLFAEAMAQSLVDQANFVTTTGRGWHTEPCLSHGGWAGNCYPSIIGYHLVWENKNSNAEWFGSLDELNQRISELK